VVGKPVTITFDVELKNDNGTIKGENNASSGETVPDLAVEVGEGVMHYNNYPDTSRNTEIPVGEISMSDFGVGLLKTLAGELDSTGRVGALITYFDGAKSIANLQKPKTRLDLLLALELFLKLPDVDTLANFLDKLNGAAGVTDITQGRALWGKYLTRMQETDWTVERKAILKAITELESQMPKQEPEQQLMAMEIDPNDIDGDGYSNNFEIEAGSFPNNPLSTPEHAIISNSCNDGVDNDLDGYADLLEPDGNDYSDSLDCQDTDGDTVVDFQDNCESIPNADQADADYDGVGDPCDAIDDDPYEYLDSDNDNIGDDADLDDDNDGFPDTQEITLGSDPYNYYSTPEDLSMIETCEDDEDNDLDSPTEPGGGTDLDDTGCLDTKVFEGDFDFIPLSRDNCPTVNNANQANTDLDPYGDACDPDVDNDSICNYFDNCLYIYNPDQKNNDRDRYGDVCDRDDDNDLVPDIIDNCPFVANHNQSDRNNNGVGDACELPPPKIWVYPYCTFNSDYFNSNYFNL